MWSGRFREPPDPRFEQWQRSFPFDWRLLREELAASAAHARTLQAAGVLTTVELGAITRGLETLDTPQTLSEAGTHHRESSPEHALATWGYAAPLADPTIEDIHHYVESALSEAIGPVALKLHTGRSRNEQIATDLRLFTRSACDQAVDALRAWALALLEQASEAGDAVMPSYTHLQRAEPVLVAHWLLAYVAMIERDLSRLKDCRARLNQCPLGSGPIAGATMPFDRWLAVRELHFDVPTANSMDATSDRDFAIEFAQTAVQIGIHLSRFAEEITLLATAEYGFIDLPEAFSTGSSAMPQKKNPDLTELVRGKTGRLIGAATTLTVILKGLPLAYNKDMQETQEAVFEVAETLLPMLDLIAPFTAGLRFNQTRMAEAATSGYLNAMAAATYLVAKGVPFRIAHEKIGAAVRFAIERNVELGDLSLNDLQQFGHEFAEDFYPAVALEATLDCHDVIGGTARHRVRAALLEARERFSGVAVDSPATAHVA